MQFENLSTDSDIFDAYVLVSNSHKGYGTSLGLWEESEVPGFYIVFVQ